MPSARYNPTTTSSGLRWQACIAGYTPLTGNSEVQKVQSGSSKTSAATFVLTSAVTTTTGNSLIVRLAWLSSASTAPTVTVSDSVNGSYTQDVTDQLTLTNSIQAAIFRFSNATSITSTATLTITPSSNFNAIGASWYEYTGNLALDVSNHGTGTAGSQADSGLVTVGAGELVIGLASWNDAPRTITQPLGWTGDATAGTSGGGNSTNTNIYEAFILALADVAPYRQPFPRISGLNVG